MALGVAGVFAIASPFMASFLNFLSYVPIVLLGVSTSFYLVLPACTGTLQGLQKFAQITVNRIGERAVLLVAGAALVAVGLGVNGTMIGLGIAGAAMLFLAAWPLRHLYARKAPGVSMWKAVAVPGMPVMITVCCIALLGNLDLVVAKRYLEPTDAGLYSAIARTGKIVFFITIAFSRALFPKSTQEQALGHASTYLMMRGVGYIGAFCLLSIFVAAAVGKPVMGLVYGDEYAVRAGLLPWYIGAVSLLSLATVMMYHNMAVSSSRHVLPLVAALALQVLLMAFFHASSFQIVMDLTISLLALLAMNIAIQLIWPQRMPVMPAQQGATEGHRGVTL